MVLFLGPKLSLPSSNPASSSSMLDLESNVGAFKINISAYWPNSSNVMLILQGKPISNAVRHWYDTDEEIVLRYDFARGWL